MENKINHEIKLIKADSVFSEDHKHKKIKNPQINKIKIIVQTLDTKFIPFNLENLVIYKKFLSSENRNFFGKDLLNFYLNVSRSISNELYLRDSLNRGDNKEIIENKVFATFVNSPIDKVFKIFLSLFHSHKLKVIKNYPNFISDLISESNYICKEKYNLLKNDKNPENIPIEDINEYSKKAPFSFFKERVSIEAFEKDAKLIEPVLITIFNFAYYIIYFLLKLTDSLIISTIYPKTLKKKLVDLDALFVKYKNSKNRNDKNSEEDEFKMIFDFLKLNNQSTFLLDDLKSREELNNQTLNLINSLLNFFKRLPNKSKRLISGSQGILEILINLLVYKNYLDQRNTENFKSKNAQNDKSHDNINKNYRVESLFAQKLISVLSQFDKLLIFKSIIMMIDLNKNNKNYLRIISKFNTLIALQSYNNIMCLFNVFDLSNLNFDTTTKLVKKLFCAVPQSMDKKDYFVKLIDCFWDLIIILKNRDKDEKLCGVKDFAINIFTEITLNFCEDLEFSSYLFYKLYYRFFRLFGFAIHSGKYNYIKNNLSRTKERTKCNGYFFRFFPKNKERLTVKISSKMLCYLKFLIANFSFLIKSKFQKLFEATDNSLIFQGLIEILSTFIKNKKIEELEDLEESIDESIKSNNIAKGSAEDYALSISETCCLLLENFEVKNIAEMFFNYYNSELLENVFDLKPFIYHDSINLTLKNKPSNIIIEYEIIESSIKDDKKINNDSTFNKLEKEIKLIIKKSTDLYGNLLYYSNYQVTLQYMNIIQNLFELSVFNNLEFFCAFNEIISKSNFFEKKNFSFLDTLNEENIFLYYSKGENQNQNSNKALNLDLLKLNFFINISEDEVLDFVFKINNFYMILKNKIFQTFAKKVISNENFLCNKEQAFKFILMILSIIPDKEAGVEGEGESHLEEAKGLQLSESMYYIDEEMIQLVIHILGFILIDVVNAKDDKEPFKNIKNKDNSINNNFDKGIEDHRNKDGLNMQRPMKQIILENSEKLISIIKKFESKFADCESILETLKLLSLQNQNSLKNLTKEFNKNTNNNSINVSNRDSNLISEKDNLNNNKLLNLFEKIEAELNNIYQINNYNSNFERSFVLYKTYNLLSKEIRNFKIEKIKIKNPTKEVLEKIKILFDIFIGFIKNIDDYFWKIAQKNIITFFEIFFIFENRNYFELFFNLVNSTIKEIKNLAECNEYAKKQKAAFTKDKSIDRTEKNKTEKSALLLSDDVEIKQIFESGESTKANDKRKNKAEFDDRIKLEKKLNKKQLEINFESQYFLKVIELLESIIKKNKSAIVIFYKHIFKLIFQVFDSNFYTYDAIIISSLFSILGTIISYCGLEINQELNTLTRTCLNILKNFNENNLIRQACANLLYKILTNCDFLHYQIYAKDIYGVIKLNLDRRIDNDKIVLFFVDKSMKFIRQSVYDFYNKEIELELIKQKLVIKAQGEEI